MAQPKGLPAEQVRSEIAAKIAAMDAIIARCEAHFGCQGKALDDPILGPLTATQWRKLHLVHGRHRQKQFSGFAKARRGKWAERGQAQAFF
jgi:hypothetical protein